MDNNLNENKRPAENDPAFVSEEQKRRFITKWLIKRTREAYKPRWRRLHGTERLIYKWFLYNAVMLNTERFTITVQTNAAQLSKIYDDMCMDNPALFFLDGFSYCVSDGLAEITMKYDLSFDETVNNAAVMEKALRRLKTACEGKSFLEKELIVHNCLTSEVTYDLEADIPKYDSHSIFLHGRAVCAGMSESASVMFGYIGIDSYTVVGDYTPAKDAPENPRHEWNMVRIGDCFYHFDVTFDNSLSRRRGTQMYTYFNLTDEQIAKDHRFSAALGRSGTERVDYYTLTGSMFDDKESLREFIAERLRRKESLIRFRMSYDINKDEADKIEDIIADVRDREAPGTAFSYCSYFDSNSFAIMIGQPLKD